MSALWRHTLAVICLDGKRDIPTSYRAILASGAPPVVSVARTEGQNDLLLPLGRTRLKPLASAAAASNPAASASANCWWFCFVQMEMPTVISEEGQEETITRLLKPAV